MSRRRTRDLRRKSQNRTEGKTVLIVCEGGQSEPNYFRGLRAKLRLPSVNVDIIPSGSESAPISVVDKAIDLKRKAGRDGYDEVWIVIDVDVHESLPQALDKAKGNNINVALTNPCIEFWFILHFTKTSAQMTNHGAESMIKEYLPNYSKGDRNIFEILFPKMEDAVKRAEQVLKEKCIDADPRYVASCNPSTLVHRLVRHLQQIKREMKRT